MRQPFSDEHHPDDLPTLTLSIGYHRIPPAAETGGLLQDIDKAFVEYNGVFGALGVSRIEIASLSAFFKTGLALSSAAYTVWEVRAGMVGFVQACIDVVANVRTATGGALLPGLVDFVSIVIAPVASDDARDARLQVVGDNNTIFLVSSPAEAVELQQRIEEYQGRPPGGIAKPIAGYINRMGLTKPIDRNVLDSGAGTLSPDFVPDAQLFSVNGRWFAAIRSLGDALVPLTARSRRYFKDLDRARQYPARGHIRERGLESEFDLLPVDPMSGSKVPHR